MEGMKNVVNQNNARGQECQEQQGQEKPFPMIDRNVVEKSVEYDVPKPDK